MKRSSLLWSCCAALLLSACHGADDDKPGNPTPTEPTPTTLTVTGKVLEGVGTASKTAWVLIPGNGRQPVAVDGSGAFSIAGVNPPYDVIVAEKERRVATIYKGLTRQDLTIGLEYSSNSAVEHEATVKGTVTGGQSSSPSTTEVSFVLPRSITSVPVEPSGAYSMNPHWNDATPPTGTLYALQFEGSGSITPSTRYLAFGQRDNVTLTENATLSAQDIALSPVTNSSLAGNITLPEGYSLWGIVIDLVPKPALDIELFSDFSAKSTFNYVVPQIPQATFLVQVSARTTNPEDPSNSAFSAVYKSGLTAGTQSAALVVPPASSPILPANGAVDVTRTTGFSWSPFANSVYVLRFQENGAPDSSYKVTLYMSGTQTTLPDLSALGMSLPANTGFTWRVQALAPFASMDELAGFLLSGLSLQDRGDASMSSSVSRTFTTAATP
jgi:hypothetical protein